MNIFRFLWADRENLIDLYGQNTVDYYRAVFLSNLGRSFAAMLVFVHVIIMFPGTYFLDTQTKLWLAPFAGALVLMLCLAARLVEKGKNVAARTFTNITVAVSTMISVILCGGFVESHATPFLLAPIVVGFCISPRNEAIAVGILTFFIPLGIDLVARANGWIIPNYTSVSNPTANVLFLMLTLFVTIFISLSYLQTTNDELHVALDREKRLFKNWASQDPLTEIGNRRYFDLQLENAIKKARETEGSFSVLFIDLNGFREINDRFGHDAGDDVLKGIAQRLKGSLQPEDHLARLGGDEFAILVSSLSDKNGLAIALSGIDRALKEPIIIEGEIYRVSASIGKSIYPENATTPSELLRMADMDMYAQKMADRLIVQHEKIKAQKVTR